MSAARRSKSVSAEAGGTPQAAARTGMRVAREGGRNDMDLVLALKLEGDEQESVLQRGFERAQRVAESARVDVGQ